MKMKTSKMSLFLTLVTILLAGASVSEVASAAGGVMVVEVMVAVGTEVVAVGTEVVEVGTVAVEVGTVAVEVGTVAVGAGVEVGAGTEAMAGE